jgi:hypothetical protein
MLAIVADSNSGLGTVMGKTNGSVRIQTFGIEKKKSLSFFIGAPMEPAH